MRSGKKFWIFDPRSEDVDIEDVAHHLSLICRFGGAVKQFYSVAEHCVRVSRAVPPEYALEALLHDAAEAYLGMDVIRPIKRRQGIGPVLVEIEDRIQLVIRQKWGLPHFLSIDVAAADNVLLVTERRDLLVQTSDVWVEDEDAHRPLDEVIRPWSSELAADVFLHRFRQLLAARDGRSVG
jgi:hypothetical protein